MFTLKAMRTMNPDKDPTLGSYRLLNEIWYVYKSWLFYKAAL